MAAGGLSTCVRERVRVCTRARACLCACARACLCACSSRRHRGRLCPRRQAAAGGPVMFVLARARACACAHRRHRGRRRRTCAPDAAVRPSGRWPPQDLPPAVPLPLPPSLPYPRTPPVPILGSLYDIVLYSFGPKRISRPPAPPAPYHFPVLPQDAVRPPSSSCVPLRGGRDIYLGPLVIAV